MFNDIYEDNNKVYEFPIEKFNFDSDIELLLKLNEVKKVEDLLKFNAKTFKSTFNGYSKQILMTLKKFGFRLSNGSWEKNGRILVDKYTRDNGLML